MRISGNPIAVQSQNWIYASFMELLASISYHEITVSMICRNAGIDRRTFYRYFDNKDDVLNSCMDKVFREYVERLGRIRSRKPLPYMRLFFEFWHAEYHALLRALLRDRLLHAVFTDNERYLTEIARVVDAARGRKSNGFEIAYRAGGLMNVLSSWLANGCIETPDEMAAIVAKVLR